MFFFYWMVAIMPLDEHPIWGRVLIGTFTTIKLVGIFALLAALWHAWSEKSLPSFLSSSVSRALLAFMGIAALSFLVHANDLVNPGVGSSHLTAIITLFFTATILVDRRSRLHWSLLVAIGSAAFVSLHAVRQQQVYGGAGFRAAGLLSDSNEYALIVGLWMPLAFLWSCDRHLPKWQRAFCFGSLLVCLLGTTFAASRGSFLGLVVGFLFLVLKSRRPFLYIALVTALILPLSLLSPMSPLRRLTEPGYGDKVAENARRVAWRAGMKMIYEHPLTGVGLHNFKPIMPYYQDSADKVVSLAHNTYIELAAELGVLGGVAFVAVLATAFRTLMKVHRRATARNATYFANTALGLQAGLASYAISAFFVTGWWEKMAWLLIFSAICLESVSRSTLRRRRKKPEDVDNRHTAARRLAFGAAVRVRD